MTLRTPADVPAMSEAAIKDNWLKQAARIAGLGYYVWDVIADRCIFCSEEHARIHGLSQEEYIAESSTLNGFAHRDDQDKVAACFQALRRGEAFDLEYRIVRPDQTERYVHEIGQPIFDDSGRVVHEIGTCRDITHQMSTVLALRTAEESMLDGIEALPLGFAIYDREGHLSFFNRRYKDLLPRSRHLLRPGLHFADLLRNSAHILAKPCGYQTPEAYLRDRINSFRNPGQKWVYRQSNGRWINATQVRSRAGGTISIMQDVTEEYAQNAKLLHAQKMDALGQLTGGLAHDFNNLLAVIRSNAELLGQGNAQTPGLVDEIVLAAQRGAELTNRLLAFSRQQTLRPLTVSPSDLVEGLLSMLRRVLGETIEVSIKRPERPWNVTADPAQLESAILNLAINGRDAMKSQGGKLTILIENATITFGDRLSEDLEPGDYVLLAVQDTGVGMFEDQKAHAFEPFYTTKETGKGSGLGLSMVYGFAQQSGGVATIESEPGVGTRVNIWMRRSIAETTGVGIGETDAAPRGHGETILVIEDDPQLQRATALMLDSLGYETLLASDSESAFALISQGVSFDIVLSDVVLPGGTSGPEIIEKFGTSFGSVKAIFMSGYAHDTLQGQAALMDGYPMLSKPFSLKALAQTIRVALA